MSGAEQSIVSGRQSRAEQTDDFVDQDTRADVVSVERCFSPVFGDSRYIERRGTCHQLWIQYQLFIRYSIPYGTLLTRCSVLDIGTVHVLVSRSAHHGCWLLVPLRSSQQ